MNDTTKTEGGVINLLGIRGGRANREPQLTDAELIAVRRMLREHDEIARECPLAGRILSKR